MSSLLPTKLLGPCRPVEWGFVDRIPCPDTEQLAASVGGLGQSYLPRFDELLNSRPALCHYVTAAVQAGLTPPRGQSDRSTFRVRWDPSPPQVHSTYIFNEACVGFLMRFCFIGICPLHLVSLFILSPSRTFVFLFSFMSSCLHVLSSHPFFCLRTHQPWP